MRNSCAAVAEAAYFPLFFKVAEETYVLKVDLVSIARTDTWEDRNWYDPVLVEAGESLRLRILLSHALDTMTLRIPLSARTLSTSETGREVVCDSTNSTLNPDNRREVRCAIPAQQVISLGVVTGGADNTDNEFASADVIALTDTGGITSNYHDSSDFDYAMAAKFGSGLHRGSGRSDFAISPPDHGSEPNIGAVFVPPSNWAYLESGGTEPIRLVAGDIESQHCQIQNQADVLYLSGHGSHVTGAIFVGYGYLDATGQLAQIGGFSPAMAAGHWNKDLQIVITAGCSVFAIGTFVRDYGDGKDPGKAWMTTGPKYFLGYGGSAPGDEGGAPERIAFAWAAGYNDMGTNAIAAWRDANEENLAWNACAVDQPENKYYYFRETFPGFRSWTEVTIP